MPRMKNVSNGELRDCANAVDEFHMTADELANRIRNGYVEPIEDPVQMASSFLAASRSLSDLAASLLLQVKLDEMRRSAEKMIFDRVTAAAFTSADIKNEDRT